MIFLGFGSNLANRYGGRRLIILRALEKLESKGVRIVKSSPFYETSSSVSRHDPMFINMVAQVNTDKSAAELLKICLNAEQELGRIRVVKNGPRIIDINLIAYHDQIIRKKNIQIPHPDLANRGYILYPLRDIAPQWMDPSSKKMISEMVERIPSRQVVYKV